MDQKYYDISVPISTATTTWPGDPKVAVRQVASIANGDESNISLIRICVHTGTHIDAPRHFLDDGKTIDQIVLKKLVGPTLVMQINEDIDVITGEVLKQHPLFRSLEQVKKVLFKTRNSHYWYDGVNEFREDYVGLDQTAAQLLAERDMELVGVDYLSIATFKTTETPHKILLRKEVVLLEGIDLNAVPEGRYELICLPLLIRGCEGSPVRAILKQIPK